MGRHSYTISSFICPECGLIMPLPRGKAKLREHGHIKDIYCAKCGTIRKFTEVKSCEFIGTLAEFG